MSREEEAKKNEIDSTMQVADRVKGMVQVEQYAGSDFSVGEEYVVDMLLFDTLLIKFEEGDNEMVNKGGIFINTNITNNKVWRVGKVILAGEGCRIIKSGDFVTFPNDKGIPTKSVNVEGHGVVKDCLFIAEDRIFGRCKKV